MVDLTTNNKVNVLISPVYGLAVYLDGFGSNSVLHLATVAVCLYQQCKKQFSISTESFRCVFSYMLHSSGLVKVIIYQTTNWC